MPPEPLLHKLVVEALSADIDGLQALAHIVNERRQATTPGRSARESLGFEPVLQG